MNSSKKDPFPSESLKLNTFAEDLKLLKNCFHGIENFNLEIYRS